MVSGYCEEKYFPVKKIFENSFILKEEIGASFSIYKNGSPIINLWGGLKDKKKNWEKDTIVNIFSATKGIYETCVAFLFNENQIDLEKPVCHYWNEFRSSDKREIKIKHILNHQSGLYRFKQKITQEDLLDWNKIINILQTQMPDHKSGEKTYYHAKTHGYLIGEIVRKITNKTIGEFLNTYFSKKLNLNLFIGVSKDKLSNIANLYSDPLPKSEEIEFNAFNNPKHEISFYNTKAWQLAEVPSMNGHANASSIAKIYDLLANDYKFQKKNLLSKNTLDIFLHETENRIDQSLMMPIRWSDGGFILRGGWLFGKNKESFGHNGWGGSLGFADPINGIGIAYTTNKINPSMAADLRIINLLKKFYEII
jgi:CubicO group peptidase (beta-lactamase class C family)